MIVALLLLSALVGASAAGVALWLGWGLLASLLIYSLGGSLTLLLLAAIVSRLLFPDDPGPDE
jgi:hypothetical protein